MSAPGGDRSTAEEVLVAFLDEHAEPSPAEVEALCAEHPEHSSALRLLLAAHRDVQAGLPDTLTAEERARQQKSRGADTDTGGGGSFEAGRTVGDFLLVRLLGRGGMGEVWEAEEQSLRRKVALKLLLPGRVSEKAIEFFAREARAGGKLSHPGIVAVHGSGEIDGVHWIAMDLVEDGASLADFLEDVRGEAELPKDYYGQVAELMARVADAMEVAHGAGVIHRDIKPANILISPDDTPKVGDFGLARVESEHGLSQTGDFAGTYYYMSPEQVMAKRMGIDHRTDIFSLGVVLYELLSLQRPFEGDTTHQIAHKVVMVDPADPRTLRSRVPDDLAVICAKAIEKNPDHRYSTMAELAADIRRHMAHEPILARPPTLVVRATKWVRRNPTKSVAGALASVALVAISTLAWQLSQEKDKLAETNQQLQTKTEEAEHNAYLATDRADELVVTNEELRVQRQEAEDARVEAASERDLATQRAEELQQVSDFQAGQLSGVDAQAMGLTIRAMVLERARAAGERAGRAPEELAEERAELEKLLAGADFTGLALGVLDQEVFEGALRELEGFGNQPLVQARLLQTVATTLRELGLLDRALEPQERAVEIRKELLGGEHPETLSSLNSMGSLLQTQGKLDDAASYFREALRIRRSTLGDEHPDTLSVINNLGLLLQAHGRADEAEPYFREALEGFSDTLGAEHPNTLRTISSLGLLLHSRGELAKAESLMRQALDGFRSSLGAEHPDTLKAVNNLGFLLQAQGRRDEAEPLLREALEKFRKTLGAQHPSTLTSLNNLGVLLVDQRKFDEAELPYRESLEGRRLVLGDGHPDTLQSMNNLGVLLKSLGRLDESESLHRQALEAQRRTLGKEHPSTLASLNNLGALLFTRGKLEEAELLGYEALEGFRHTLGSEHPHTLLLTSNLGYLRQIQGKFDEAEPLFRTVLEIRARTLGEDHPSTLSSRKDLAELIEAKAKAADEDDQ